jgi:integrase
MWRLLAWTGMRRGEVLALKWADFRTDTRTMTIRRTISLVGAQAFVSTPKSAQARAVDLDRETIAIPQEAPNLSDASPPRREFAPSRITQMDLRHI